MDAGHYNCEIKVPSPMNPVDNVGNGTELVVHAPPSMSDIIKSAETVMADISIRLTCKVNDFFPEPISIVWYLQNTRMTNGVKSMPPLKGSEGEFSVYSHLMLTPKAKDQGLNFTCQVHHITLSAPMSRSISLSVKYAPTNQTLYHRSSDQDKPRVLSRRRIYTPPGSYLELQCVVESQPESVVKWLNPGGTMLSNASNSNATLTLNPVQERDEGMYECSATNDYGSEKMKIRIDVNPESTLAVRLVTYPLFVIIVSSLLLYSRFCKDHFQSIFINAEENETLETDNLP
ncbi:sialic acid-binding Ig-like lectin 14 isoform X2 [Amia ocellicauda]